MIVLASKSYKRVGLFVLSFIIATSSLTAPLSRSQVAHADFAPIDSASFADKVDYATGVGPSSVAVADFNGDGQPDLAVADAESNAISIFLGNSNGTFATEVSYNTGAVSAPISIIAADFNGDSKPDLAVVNGGSNNVSILLNTGNGTFATDGHIAIKADYATGSFPVSVIAADFNGDGKADLAVANSDSNTVSVYINNGGGTFATKVDYNAKVDNSTFGSMPTSVTTADFNSDGKPDLAVTNGSSNTVSVFVNNGDGTFANKVDYAAGKDAISVTAADFNGDNKPDLAVANYNGGYSSTVSVLINNGDGTFATKVNYITDTGSDSIAAADFNGDGKQDLAVTNNVSKTISVLPNNGDGTFANKVDYTTGSFPSSIAAADFNGDGKQDLAVTNYGYNTVSVFLNTTATTVSRSIITTQAVSDITTTTATGKGSVDMTKVVGNLTGSIEWGLSSGNYSTGSCDTTILALSTGDYSCQMSSLAPNTTYFVRAKTTDSVGTTSYGTEVSFTTSKDIVWSSTINNNDPDASKDNLVVITHGWKGSAADGWMTEMRDSIITNSKPNTAVRLYDWETKAAGCVVTMGKSVCAPFTAYANAPAEGGQLAQQIEAQLKLRDPKSDPMNIHLIAHSAGSNVIRTAMNQLADYVQSSAFIKLGIKKPIIRMTYLDAYAPYANDYNGDDNNFGIPDGLTGYAEQYVDTRLASDFLAWNGTSWVDATKVLLPNVANFDVTSLDTDDLYSGDIDHNHKWPIYVYTDSITDNGSNFYNSTSYNGKGNDFKFGFQFAAENNVNVVNTTSENSHKSQWCVVTDVSNPYRKCSDKWTDEIINGVITNTTTPAIITVPSKGINLIDASDLIKSGTGLLPKITINSDLVNIFIPSNTIVKSADPSWDGMITAPTRTINPLDVSTTTNWEPGYVAFEVGSSSASLTFDHAVAIFLPGMGGRHIGFVRPGVGGFTEINDTCYSDSQSAGNALPAGGNCKITINGKKDLVVWTKHFTTFVAYTPNDATPTAPVVTANPEPKTTTPQTSSSKQVANTNNPLAVSTETSTLDETTTPTSNLSVLGDTTIKPETKLATVTNDTPKTNNVLLWTIGGAAGVIIVATASAFFIIRKRRAKL